MDLSTGRLEGLAGIQEHPFNKGSDEQKRRSPRRPREQVAPGETDEAVDEQENHQLDDIA